MPKKADEKSKMFNKLQTSTKYNIMERTIVFKTSIFTVQKKTYIVLLKKKEKNWNPRYGLIENFIDFASVHEKQPSHF